MDFITDPLLQQLTWAGVFSWLYQKAKQAPWFPAVSEKTSRILQTLYGAVIAAAQVLALNWTYDAAAGELVVRGLTLSGMGGAVLAFMQAWVAQILVYHGVVKTATAPSATTKKK